MKHKKYRKILYIVLSILVFIAIEFFDIAPNDLKTSIKDLDQKNKVEKKVLQTDGNLTVSFLNVGQADCIYIHHKDHSMLIDAGNNEDGKYLVDYFQSLGIEKFDYVVGTHPHEDHIGGLDDMIRAFSVNAVYMPKIATTTKTFEDVLNAVKEKNLKIATPTIGDTFSLGDAVLEVISVHNDASDLNDSSIVLHLTYGKVSYLFTGDASSKVEKEILEKDISSDVLKVGHHGSEYSSNLDFLKKVNPKYAIISVGKDNIYDHPRLETLEKLESLNVEIYRTDELGTITTVTDGENIKISYKETNTNG